MTTKPENPPLYRAPDIDPPAGPEPSGPVTAKAFRRRILRPAQGIFLFHERAIERLRAPGRLDGARPVAGLCYQLMARRPFLERLESENPEALSVIEGLPLPDWILLLPMPGAAVLRSTGERTLLRDYWARRFEGETARALGGRTAAQGIGAWPPDDHLRRAAGDPPLSPEPAVWALRSRSECSYEATV